MSQDKTDDKLIRMANDIANFFKAYGETEAVAGIRHHIESFWTPAMRTALGRRIGLGEAASLHPFALAALHSDPPVSSPAERESAGPAEVGQIGASDAG